MKKVFLKLHLWIAFPLGLIITVICLSGAILAFRTEIEEAIYFERYFLNTQTEGAEKLSLAQLRILLEVRLGEPVSGFTIPADTTRNYTAMLTSNPRALVYVNPYTGDVIGRSDTNSFFNTMLSLHRWLLNPAVGKPIVGYTTLLFVVILFTGIFIVFPNSRKKWKRILTVHLRKGWKRFWHDLHINAGMWATIVLLTLALTGLTWSFHWYNAAFYCVLGVEAPAPRGHAPHQRGQASPQREQTAERLQTSPQRGQRQEKDSSRTATSPPNRAHWDALIYKIKHDNPNFKLIAIRDGAISVTQHKRFGNSRATDTYSFDATTGEITAYVPYANQPRTNKIRGWIYSIHVGSWGGLFSKIITCFAALIGASLPLTGYYIFYKKRKKAFLKQDC